MNRQVDILHPTSSYIGKFTSYIEIINVLHLIYQASDDSLELDRGEQNPKVEKQLYEFACNEQSIHFLFIRQETSHHKYEGASKIEI